MLKRKLLFIGLPLLMVSLLTTTALSSFYFGKDISFSNNVNNEGDAIRENQTFGEEGDVVVDNLKYYDVYFLSQNVDLDNSSMMYYKNDYRYGYWENTSEWPTPSGYNNNGYNIGYRKVSNVAEITNDVLDSIGQPLNGMVDKTGDWDLHFLCWSLNPRPNMYTGDNGNGQVTGLYPYEGFEIVYFNTMLSIYDSHARMIDGRNSLVFYPIYSTGKNYINSDDAVAGNVNSKKTLRDSISINVGNVGGQAFSYDVKYSDLMKSNYGFVDVETETYETGLLNHIIVNDEAYYRAYRLSDFKIDSANIGKTVKIVADLDFAYHSWNGTTSDHVVIDISDLAKSEGRFNIFLFAKEVFDNEDQNRFSVTHDTSNQTAGTYSTKITDDEKNRINQMMSDSSIQAFKTYDGNNDRYFEEQMASAWGSSVKGTNYRTFYVYVERIYEPRVIGGPTDSLDYENDLSKQLKFIKQGTSGLELDSYILKNFSVVCPRDDKDVEYIEYTYVRNGKNVRTYRVPNYYFAIQIALDQNTIYEQKLYGKYIDEDGQSDIVSDADFAENLGYQQVPIYSYINQNNQQVSESYSSRKYLIHLNEVEGTKWDYDLDRIHILSYDENGNPDSNGFMTLRQISPELKQTVYNNLKLIRFKMTGSFNLFTRVNYSQNQGSTGTFIPSSLDLWAYRLHNIFVNIYDPADFGGQTLEIGSNYIDTKVYSYRCKEYYYIDTPVNKDDIYQRKDGLPDSTGLGTNVTFEAILDYYSRQGKCLQDVVTGKYITKSYQNGDILVNDTPADYINNPLIVESNHILQVVDIPNEYK